MSAQPQILHVPQQATVRSLQENDLPHADRIFRQAFGTFLGLPDPTQFSATADYVRSRWLADPEAAFAAELNGEIVGSNFASNWGSIGFFGPLTVRPNLWDRGIAKQLLTPVMDTFARWGTAHAGLFTFAQSAKHIGLYQKFGFWPRFLTAIMSKSVAQTREAAGWSTFSELAADRREDGLKACKLLTDAVYEGLDVSREILAVDRQKLGETILLREDDQVMGLAVCHCGPSTEAGSDTCYVKFGTVRPAKKAAASFEQLLRACEGLAHRRNLPKLTAGVNMGRQRAYRKMLAAGFRAEWQGVTMHRPNELGYDRSTTYLIDDWR
jgi:GNAT superfamily N-acetyltransferase